jgi:hypothetical protein
MLKAINAIKEFFFGPELTPEQKAHQHHEQLCLSRDRLIAEIDRQMRIVVWTGRPDSFNLVYELDEGPEDGAINMALQELNSRVGSKWNFSHSTWNAGVDQIVQIFYDKRVLTATDARQLYSAISCEDAVENHLKVIDLQIVEAAKKQTWLEYAYTIHPGEDIYPQRTAIRTEIAQSLRNRSFFVTHRSYVGTTHLRISWEKV